MLENILTDKNLIWIAIGLFIGAIALMLLVLARLLKVDDKLQTISDKIDKINSPEIKEPLLGKEEIPEVANNKEETESEDYLNPDFIRERLEKRSINSEDLK
jgi:hypothetical protein